VKKNGRSFKSGMKNAEWHPSATSYCKLACTCGLFVPVSAVQFAVHLLNVVEKNLKFCFAYANKQACFFLADNFVETFIVFCVSLKCLYTFRVLSRVV